MQSLILTASPTALLHLRSSPVAVDTSALDAAVAECSSSLSTCPICNKSCASCSLLWQHINSVHISRAVFPPAAFFTSCNCLNYSVSTCYWASHERYHKTGCRCLPKPGQHCNAPLVLANEIPCLFSPQPPSRPLPFPLATSIDLPSDPLDLAFLSASACSFIGPESGAVSTLLEAVMDCPVSTVVHIPCSVLSKVLAIEFRNATSSLWGFVHLFLFTKVVLRMPPFRQRRCRFVLASVLLDCLHIWSQSDGLCMLWKALQDDLIVSESSFGSQSTPYNVSQALFWVREGRYSNAVQALTSTGVAYKNDDLAFQELLERHPTSDPPTCPAPESASLTVDESAVIRCLKEFPRGTSPGASGLRAQHLLDVISGHTTSSAEDCLLALTRLMNFLLSGKVSPLLAPWLCGAPLMALLKKNGVSSQLLQVKFFVALPVVCAVT